MSLNDVYESLMDETHTLFFGMIEAGAQYARIMCAMTARHIG